MTAESDLHDLYIASMARELRDGDRLFIGINQRDVALAALLARRLWAPGLKFWASGTAVLRSLADDHLVGRGSYENSLVAARPSFFWQARAFDEMGLRSAVCFAGGLQVDRRGNANLAGIRTGEEWALRGPGSAGLPSLTAWAERFYIAVPIHSERTMVEKCSLVSVVGDPVRRKALGMNPQALVAVVTPLARFEPSDEGLVLTEVAPGVSIDDVRQSTSFRIDHSAVAERRPLSGAERDALRSLQR